MDGFVEFCQSWTMGGIATRLFLATLAGVIIGMDREYKNKGAGIKTHALVCIGAALSMIVNEFILRTFPSSNTDLARMGAQVISGIGFIKGTLLALLFVIFILRVLEPIDKKLRARSRDFDLYVEFKDLESIHQVIAELRSQGVKVSNFSIYKRRESVMAPAATLTVKVPRHGQHEIYVQKIREIEGIIYAEEI